VENCKILASGTDVKRKATSKVIMDISTNGKRTVLIAQNGARVTLWSATVGTGLETIVGFF
jgi:hypothetical protein